VKVSEHVLGDSRGRVALNGSEVHVWFVSLDQSACCVGRLADLLSPDERTRAERFYFERDRARFIAGRGLLRTILAFYSGADPRRLEFRYGPRGKPSLAPGFGDLRFNLSHARGRALYAIARGREIGVDIEEVRPMPDAEKIAERFFSRREYQVFRALPASARPRAFFDCWTRKEAFIKALGDGLAYPLDRFDVSLSPGEPARLLRIEGDPQGPAGWSLRELALGLTHVAALAVEGHGLDLSCRRLPREFVDAG